MQGLLKAGERGVTRRIRTHSLHTRSRYYCRVAKRWVLGARNPCPPPSSTLWVGIREKPRGVATWEPEPESTSPAAPSRGLPSTAGSVGSGFPQTREL